MFEKLFSSRQLVLFVVLAHLPIGLEYSIRMWRTGHYQFFPLLVLVIAWFWYQMNDSLRKSAEAPKEMVLSLSLVANLVLVLVATVLRSSFIGSLSFVFMFVNTLYACYGASGLRIALPLVFLSLFTVPLPARIDSWLIFNLQFLASQLASWILDAFHQIHFREGVVLKTETRGFLTEEACSGIRSLFSSVAGIAIYGVTLGYRWWRHLFNLCQTVCWVVIGNAFRVAIVVYVSENYSDRIASGRPHEFLGMLVFLMIFLLAVSTDRLFAAFVRETDDSNSLADYGYGESPEDIEEPVVEHEEDESLDEIPTFGFLGKLELFKVGMLVIPLALIVFCMGARISYVSTFLNQGIAAYSLHRLPFPQRSDLPVQIGDWQQVDFQHENRGKDKLQAEDSFIWTYENNGLRALVSVDCPWDTWHDLTICYSGLGWNTAPRHFFQGGEKMDDVQGFEAEQFSQIGMNKSSGETGVVIFSSVDATGKMVTPQFSAGFFSMDSIFNQLASNTATALGLGGQQASGWMGYKLPLSTLQLYCTPETELNPAQIRSLRRLFTEARKLLVQSERFNQP